MELTKPRITMLILICTVVGNWLVRLWRLVSLDDSSSHSPRHDIAGVGNFGTQSMVRGGFRCEDAPHALAPSPRGKNQSENMVSPSACCSPPPEPPTYGTARTCWRRPSVCSPLLVTFCSTPLKQRSPACTAVGAIAGAMPPLIGYAAAGHRIDASVLALSLILFVWQFPHFVAIAWMYRDDYAHGGFTHLPVIDLAVESTAKRIEVCSLLLIPTSLVPLFLGMTGALCAVAATAAGLGLLYYGARLGRARTSARARTAPSLLFRKSLYTW